MTDVPDLPLEPSDEPVPRRWCDRCINWAECPCGCGFCDSWSFRHVDIDVCPKCGRDLRGGEQ